MADTTSGVPAVSMPDVSAESEAVMAIERLQPQDLLKDFPRREFVPRASPTYGEINSLSEPESLVSWKRFAAMRSISTYPRRDNGDGTLTREGDPVCDQYFARFYENQAVLAVADGCSWGVKPYNAAVRAIMQFSRHVADHLAACKDTRDIGETLLRATAMAHCAVVQAVEDHWDAGSTTLLGGALVELKRDKKKDKDKEKDKERTKDKEGGKDSSRGERRFAWVGMSLGDCKVMSVGVDGEVTDLTPGQRTAVTDVRDPGGRVGPYNDDGEPDFRNLKLAYHELDDGEHLLFVSDGIHDNIDPQNLGIQPHAFNAPGEQYRDGDDTSNIKHMFTRDRLRQLTTHRQLLARDRGVVPQQVVDTLITESWRVTLGGRRFMEWFPNRKQPQDYFFYPGKMDHTTAMMVCATRYPVPSSSSEFAKQLSVDAEYPSVMLPSPVVDPWAGAKCDDPTRLNIQGAIEQARTVHVLEIEPMRKTTEGVEDNGVDADFVDDYPEINPSEVMFFEKLGAGTMGVTFKGECRELDVCIKRLWRQQIEPSAMLSVIKSIDEYRVTWRHPNIVAVMGICTMPPEIAVVTELCARGNLNTVLSSPNIPLSMFTKMSFARDILIALDYMHSREQPQAHPHFVPENVHVGTTMRVKLGDIVDLNTLLPPRRRNEEMSADEKNRRADAEARSVAWMAPETIENDELTCASNIWTFALLFWQIMKQTPSPYSHMNTSNVAELRAAILEGALPPFEHLPPILESICRRCVLRDPARRPSTMELMCALDIAIVDLLVSDEHGRAFWKRNFFGRDWVLLANFQEKFLAELTTLHKRDAATIADEWKAIEDDLVGMVTLSFPPKDLGLKMRRSRPQKIITVQHFGKLLEWFGPMCRGDMLQHIFAILSQGKAEVAKVAAASSSS